MLLCLIMAIDFDISQNRIKGCTNFYPNINYWRDQSVLLHPAISRSLSLACTWVSSALHSHWPWDKNLKKYNKTVTNVVIAMNQGREDPMRNEDLRRKERDRQRRLGLYQGPKVKLACLVWKFRTGWSEAYASCGFFYTCIWQCSWLRGPKSIMGSNECQIFIWTNQPVL